MKETGKRWLPAGCSRVNKDYAGLCANKRDEKHFSQVSYPFQPVFVLLVVLFHLAIPLFFAHEDTTNIAAREPADGFNAPR